MPQLIQVRTNTRFNLNYQSHKLEPEIELIFLISSPKYAVNAKKGEINKEHQVSEIRFDTNPDGIKKIIGQLTALQIPIATFENMGEAFNTIITNSETK